MSAFKRLLNKILSWAFLEKGTKRKCPKCNSSDVDAKLKIIPAHGSKLPHSFRNNLTVWEMTCKKCGHYWTE